jgi:hypothetical protein
MSGHSVATVAAAALGADATTTSKTAERTVREDAPNLSISMAKQG